MLKTPKSRPSLSQALLLAPASRPESTPLSPDFWRTSVSPDRDRFLREWVARRRSDLLEELCHLEFQAQSHRASEIKGRIAQLDDLFTPAEGKGLYDAYKAWLRAKELDN